MFPLPNKVEEHIASLNEIVLKTYGDGYEFTRKRRAGPDGKYATDRLFLNGLEVGAIHKYYENTIYLATKYLQDIPLDKQRELKFSTTLKVMVELVLPEYETKLRRL